MTALTRCKCRIPCALIPALRHDDASLFPRFPLSYYDMRIVVVLRWPVPCLLRGRREPGILLPRLRARRPLGLYT